MKATRRRARSVTRGGRADAGNPATSSTAVRARSLAASVIRNWQTLVPGSADLKNGGRNVVLAALRHPHEVDFRGLKLLGLGPAPLCVDGGGNRGQSIRSMRLMLDAPEIVSFEPNGQLADALAARYLRDDAVRVEAVALSDRPGTLVLYVPVYRGFVFDGLASLDEGEAAGWLPRNLYRFDERKQEVRELTCRVATLDSYGLAPAFVKLDLQGHEHAALVGSTATVAEHRPVLLLETPSPSVRELLATWRYEAMSYERGALVPPSGLDRLNTYFVPEEHPILRGRSYER